MFITEGFSTLKMYVLLLSLLCMSVRDYQITWCAYIYSQKKERGGREKDTPDCSSSVERV